MLASPREGLSVFHETHAPVEAAKRRGWFPYVDNGGTVMAVAGKDFCVVCGDTRMSQGFSILSRNVSKIVKLTDQCTLASSGMQADIQLLHKILRVRLKMYQYEYGKTMSPPAIAQMLSKLLYSRRFFPYYAFNVLAGIDEEGKGCTWGYDAVGCVECLPYAAAGTGSMLLTPILDAQVGFLNCPQQKRDLTLEETLDLAKDCFTSVGERDIYTGDSVELVIMDGTGWRMERLDLKKD